MKLTQETIRQIIKEELENVLIEEGIIYKIKAFFTGDPFEGDMGGSYKPSEKYKPGTYGAFAQAAEMVGIFNKRNLKATGKTLAAAAEGMVGAGEAKISPIVGLAMAIAGFVAKGAIATGLGVAGVLAAFGGLVRLFYSDPTIAEKYPELSNLNMDPQLIKLIDDGLEEQIIDDYQKYFIEGVRKNPNEKMENINIFARDWLKRNLENRTVMGSPALDKESK